MDLINKDLVILDMKANEKNLAIKELADLLQDRVSNQQIYLQAVMKREEEFTTGIGMGIAIPHGRSNSVKKSSLCFGRSKKGINYNSTDGQPVHLLFLIAVPESSHDEHLKILSQLSRKLMHENIRQALLQAKTVDEVLTIIERE